MANRSLANRRQVLRWCGALTLHGVPGALAQAAQPATPAMRIALGNATPPLYWEAEDGPERGIHGACLELMAALVKTAGYRLDAAAFPLARVQALVEAGEMDGMINAVTPERLRYAIPSRLPLFQDKVSIFVHKDSSLLARLRQVRTLDELAAVSATVVSLNGSGWTKHNIEARGMKVYYGPGTSGEVMMLIRGRGDIVVDMSRTVNWWLAKMPGGEDIVELPQTIDTVKFHLLIGARSPLAGRMSELDNALKRLRASPHYHAILKKYKLTEPPN